MRSVATRSVGATPNADRSPRTALRWLLAAVLANYLAQIPYNLHLYGLYFQPRAVVLLGGTLLWFAVGFALLQRRSRLGYWLTVAFLAVQVAFYFHNDVYLARYGYGLPYHLTHARDMLLWTVFAIGDINFVAAIYFLYHLFTKRAAIL